MSFNTAFARKAILGAAIVSLCPSLALAGALPATLLATGNVIIPESPGAPESITFTGVALIAGQTYWVAVLPQTSDNTSGASWYQNSGLGESVDFSGDGVTWSDSGWGPTAYPGEFDVIGSTSNVLYTDMAGSPFATGHVWGIAGANASPDCSPYCYNAYASYFTPSVSDFATQIDVVLAQNGAYDPNVIVNLYTSTENIGSVPEPAEAPVLGGCLLLLALRSRRLQSIREWLNR
jgi:hypothetical protein